jgi:hypothetical protein
VSADAVNVGVGGGERARVVDPGWTAVTPESAAAMIRERLDGPAPTALRELAERV